MRVRKLLWLFLTAAALSCGSDGEVGPLECPGSTEAMVAESADRVEWWCQDSAGLANGPYELQIGGVTATTGTFSEGRADGPWLFLQPAPAAEPYARLETSYADGVPDGTWTARDENGNALYEHHWQQGAPCGVWTDTLDDGTTRESTFPPCGSDAMDREDGLAGYPRLSDEGLWDGETCPAETELVSFGNERYCADAAGLRQGPWARLTAGAYTLPIELGEFTDGLETGTWRRWHGNGVIAVEARWESGLLHGPYVATHSSGHVFEEGEYVAGRRSGEWRFGHDTGGDAMVGTYVDGLRDGRWTQWDQAGDPLLEFGYVGGLLNGPSTTWYREPTTGLRVRSEGMIIDELLWGLVTITYDESGARAGEVRYEGLRQGPYIYWWPNGNVMEEGTFITGQLAYSWRSYYENGAPWVECGRIRGLVVGPFIEYWPNGQKKAEGDFSAQGVAMEQTFTYWDEDGNVLAEYPE